MNHFTVALRRSRGIQGPRRLDHLPKQLLLQTDRTTLPICSGPRDPLPGHIATTFAAITIRRQSIGLLPHTMTQEGALVLCESPSKNEDNIMCDIFEVPHEIIVRFGCITLLCILCIPYVFFFARIRVYFLTYWGINVARVCTL